MEGVVRTTAVRVTVLVLVLGVGLGGVGLSLVQPQVFVDSTAEAGMPGFVLEPEDDPAGSPVAPPEDAAEPEGSPGDIRWGRPAEDAGDIEQWQYWLGSRD